MTQLSEAVMDEIKSSLLKAMPDWPEVDHVSVYADGMMWVRLVGWETYGDEMPVGLLPYYMDRNPKYPRVSAETMNALRHFQVEIMKIRTSDHEKPAASSAEQ